jgi:putative membrane protein
MVYRTADDFLDEAEKTRVEEAIEAAESRTSAELVCAVSTESDRYDRAESLAGLGVALVSLGVANATAGSILNTAGSWGGSAGIAFGWQVVSVVVGFVLGSVIASYWHGLRRWMVSPEHLTNAVERAAWRVFGMKRISATRRDSGLLIYISLFERRVSIVADDSARKALGSEGLEELRDVAVDQLRQGESAATFVATLQRASQRLEGPLPADDQPVDELNDQVLSFHPRPT